MLGVQCTAIAVFFLYQLMTQPDVIVEFMGKPFSSHEIGLQFGPTKITVSSYVLLVFLVVVLLGAAAFPASSMGLLTDVTDENQRGQGMGLYSALNAVGNILGILAGGIFYNAFGIQGLMTLCLTFAVISALVLVKFLLETTTFQWLPGI